MAGSAGAELLLHHTFALSLLFFLSQRLRCLHRHRSSPGAWTVPSHSHSKDLLNGLEAIYDTASFESC